MASAGFLITIYHRFCKKYFPRNWVVLIVYYIWYKTFIESYYFLCVKEDFRQIYRTMCQLICKFVVIAYISVQNMLFYN